MKISIITSCLNNVNTIKYAVKSINDQTYHNIEYILVDGGSNDGTVEFLDSLNSLNFKHSFKILKQPDRGIYHGLNSGVGMATGDYIGFLHSDDILENNRVIVNLVNALKQSDAQIVYADLVYVDKENVDKVIRYWKSTRFKPRYLKYGWLPPHPTLFVHRSIYEQYGNYDTSFKIAADYNFILKIFKTNIPKLYYPEIVYRMRLGGKSNKGLKNIVQKSKEDLRAIQQNNIGGYFTLFAKNISKIPQFITRKI